MLIRQLHHRIGEHRLIIPPFHVTVVMGGATGQLIDKKHALDHRHDVAKAHQRARDPDRRIHRDAVRLCEGGNLLCDSVLVSECVEICHFAVAPAETGRSRSIWQIDTPVPQLSLNVSEYEVFAADAAGIEVALYIHPLHVRQISFFDDAAEEIVEVVEQLLTAMAQETGLP